MARRKTDVQNNIMYDTIQLRAINYRPISLLISFSKIVKKLIYLWLYKHMH